MNEIDDEKAKRLTALENKLRQIKPALQFDPAPSRQNYKELIIQTEDRSYTLTVLPTLKHFSVHVERFNDNGFDVSTKKHMADYLKHEQTNIIVLDKIFRILNPYIKKY